MTAAAIGFYASAGIATLGALVTVAARRRDHALAGFVVALAGLLVPLIQLEAPTIAAVLLLALAVIVTLLGIVAGMVPSANTPTRGRRPIAYWSLAGVGLLGFGWVVLATGSRQVVDLGEPLARGSTFASGDALLLELATTFVAPSLILGLLALAAVIAAVISIPSAESSKSPGSEAE